MIAVILGLQNYGGISMDLETLTKMVQDKTGLDEAKAKMAVTVVLSQVKEKLPAPAQVYIDQILGGAQGDGSSSSIADVVKGGLGGLMGG
jgi:hypothetical protein